MRTVGFIYVLSNPAQPGVVKVGKTTKLAEDRAAKLRTTGVPVAFKVEFRAATSRANDVEQRAHALLAADRVAPDREFFAVAPIIAIEAIKQALLDVGGIGAWMDVDAPHVIKRRDRVALTLEAGQLFVLLSYPSLFATTPEVLDIWQAHSDGDLLELMGANAREHVAGFSDGDPYGDQDPVPCLDRSSLVANGILNGRERMVPGERLLWLAPHRDSDACAFCVFDMEDDCQVISRTWNSPSIPGGPPELLNLPTLDELPASAVRTVRAALRLPRPRSWAPRQPARSSDSSVVSGGPPPPEYWLPQLAAARRTKFPR